MTTYGYVRISSKDQHQDRQTNELIEYGIPQDNIFFDVASGKDFNRARYTELRALLKRGDMLVIKSIDRLGRNYNEIIAEWRALTQEIGINIRVLDIPFLDTTLRGEDLTGVFMGDLVLQILSYVAQTERENIRQRQREGIAIAKAQGKRLGRPRVQYPSNFDRAYTSWKEKRITADVAIKKLSLKKSTFYRMAHNYEIAKSGNSKRQ